MTCRALVLAFVVACGGGGGGPGGSHVVTVDVVGPGSVSSTPAGIDCPSAGCTGTFSDHVTLYAQPDNGAAFVGWSGACTGSNPSCTLQLDADHTASAMFAASGQQTLNVTVTGPGTVTGTSIDCPTTCSGAYDSGTVVVLSAMPGIDATFQGWGGACSGTGDCMVTMDQMRSVTATFQGPPGMHMLSVTVNGPGTVTSTPGGITCSSGTCTAMFADTDNVVLSDVPTGAATFSGWTGACNGTSACSVQMSQDRSVTAGFASSGFVLTVHLDGDGTGTATSNPAGINCTTGSSAGCSYDFGPSVNSVTITATPAATSSFAGQGSMGNYGCSGDNYGNPCSYGLNNSGVTVNVGFSGWTGKLPFPSSLTGLALVGTSYVAVGAGGNAITSTNDSAGGNGAYWTGRYALPALNALAVQSSMFYAPRDGGHVAVSADGITWTDYTAGTNDLLGVASSGTQLVAVGKTGAIEYSSNGTTWNAATSGTTQQLDDVIYAGGQFVAIGYAGTILTSTDGITWTARTSNTTNILYGIAYTGSLYVAVGASAVVVTSPTGVTWTKPTTTGLPVAALHGIAWTGTQLVAAGDAYDQMNTGHTLAFTSTNATAWTQHVTQTSNDPAVRVVAPGDGNVYVLGSSGSLQRSADASTWSFLLSPGGRGAPGQGQTTQLYSVAYSGSLWVAGGQWGSIFTSPDAVTWTSRRAAPCCDFITGVEWGAGLATPVFAAVGTTGYANYILTSPDGITWTKVFPTSGTVNGYAVGLAYGGPATGFSAVGSSYTGTADQGFAITSTDGATWTASATAPTDISSHLAYVTYGNGLFVATGYTHDTSNINGDGAIYTSTDGAAWTAQAINATVPTNAAAYGNGVYTVFESQGMGVWTSANGTTWTRSATTFIPAQGFAFGNGVFYNAALYTSTNGTTWTQIGRLPDLPEVNGGVFWAARYAGGQWVGVNADESFLTHP